MLKNHEARTNWRKAQGARYKEKMKELLVRIQEKKIKIELF